MKQINQFLLLLATLALVTFSAEGKTNCDKLGMNFYDNIGCTRQNSTGDCPSYKDCKYELKPGTCQYNGVVLKDREYIGNDQDILCNWSCFCDAPNNTKGKFECAVGECGDWLVPINPACYLEYELGQCCGTQQCEPSKTSCLVDGKTYKEGERFQAKDECSECICTSEFNGKFEGPHCKRKACDAEIHYVDKIEQQCAPVYFYELLCCPSTFICPSDTEDTFITDENNKSDVFCQYGHKSIRAGDKITRKIEYFGKTRKVTCECKLPPLLTCTAEF